MCIIQTHFLNWYHEHLDLGDCHRTGLMINQHCPGNCLVPDGQCWPRWMSPYDFTRLQCVNTHANFGKINLAINTACWRQLQASLGPVMYRTGSSRSPFWNSNWTIPVDLFQNHSYWCPGSFHHQDISSCAIEYILASTGPCLPQGRIWDTHVISVMNNNKRKWKYIFMLAKYRFSTRVNSLWPSDVKCHIFMFH